ncbi:MAG: alpha-mannosidase, partial [Phycisphaerae bacterium]|nr:alpha-mannosidase [Phycisphaerae bacterium]
MNKTLEFAARRYSVFADQVLKSAVHARRSPLSTAVFQCADPIPYPQALSAEYKPVEVGWRWGPVWSTAWFRVTGQVPAEMRGQSVALRFSSGTEALLWADGTPQQGFDVNRDLAVLHESAAGGEPVELFIEAACNHPFGVAPPWDSRGPEDRWATPTPGVLLSCELMTYDAAVWRLWRTYDFARQLMLLCEDDDSRGQQLCEALRHVTVLIDERDVAAGAEAAFDVLDAALRTAHGATTHCHAVGHAHLDTAWLWPLRETRRKCLRSFANVLGLMERYPAFRFLASQAQQYAWVEEDAPELFARIAKRVAEGRWEAGGAMWVEVDGNAPSGESFVRQILHGTRYWQRKFGEHGAQRFLFLPDTFGFPASLPQIMAQAGLGTFITNKLAWCEVNEFPLMNFRCRGIDGSEVLAHCTPGNDYNSSNTPAELLRGEKNAARKDQGRTGVWLQPFGFGDGGGGPTDWHILNADLARQCDGLPNVNQGTASAFCIELHKRREELHSAGRDLPVWDGELYLEYHRGTYTTQAATKRANRKAEQGLRIAELLTSVGPDGAALPDEAETRRRLDESWKLVLLNQFHDILPGSSIAPVYVDAHRQHAQVRETYAALINDGLSAWAGAADTRGMQQPLLVFNPASRARGGVVEMDGQLAYAGDVPALGVRVIDRAAAASVAPVTVNGHTLCNGIVSVTIDDAGRIGSLYRVDEPREAGASLGNGKRAAINQLVLYEDRPRAWDAWDIDIEYVEKAVVLDGPA